MKTRNIGLGGNESVDSQHSLKRAVLSSSPGLHLRDQGTEKTASGLLYNDFQGSLQSYSCGSLQVQAGALPTVQLAASA